MTEIKGGRSTNWLSVFLLKQKSHKEVKNLIVYLNRNNVECRPVWKPMHMQPLYSKSDFFSIAAFIASLTNSRPVNWSLPYLL